MGPAGQRHRYEGIHRRNHQSVPLQRVCLRYGIRIILPAKPLYNPEWGRFISEDTIVADVGNIEGHNLYQYCLNNPINKADYDGHKPGDLFNSIDEAARDMANYINTKSISENREYAGVIYSVKITVTKVSYSTHRFLWWKWQTKVYTKITKIQYTYKEPKKGSAAGATVPNAPLFKKKKAVFHTHAAYDPAYKNDIFSPEDKSVADRLKIPMYVATPLGTLRKYDPSTGDDIELFNDIPFDPNHPGRK